LPLLLLVILSTDRLTGRGHASRRIPARRIFSLEFFSDFIRKNKEQKNKH
jgi:hypothetical protein